MVLKSLHAVDNVARQLAKVVAKPLSIMHVYSM